MSARDLLEKLLAGGDLSGAEAEQMMGILLDGEQPEAVKAGLLVALRAKGETAEEVRGLALGMRAAARPVSIAGEELVDTCGTGGDGHHSFNISTAAALLLAAGGVKVVKHGNRSVSSQCGSADVLEALGLPMHADAAHAEAAFAAHGFTFLFAPVFHPAMKAVAPVRRALKVRTVFNVLGPLSNPAHVRYQLIGAFDPDVARLMAETVSGLPIERAFVVHGDGGWDEATPCGPFLLYDVTPGKVRAFEADPAEYGLTRRAPEELAGSDASGNAAMLRALFAGERSARRDAVLLNAALVLQLLGRHPAPRDAIAAAAAIIDDGRAAAFLDRLTHG